MGEHHSTAARQRAHAIAPDQWQIMYGSVLGDGSLGKPKTGTNYHLTIAHSERQVEYLAWKQRRLAPLASTPNVHRRLDVRYGREYSTWRFHTPSLPALTELRRECYPDGTKRLPVSLLERCNELALAVWYMDDGTNANGCLQLATVCFPEEDVSRAAEWLRSRWNIAARMTKDRRLSILREGRDRFTAAIAPHVPPCMSYKLP